MKSSQTLKSMSGLIKTVSQELQVTKDEAELIVATLLDRPRFDIYLNDHVDSATMAMLKRKLAQLKQGMPLEYVTKKVQFMDYLLDILPGVFIPRVETEYFVELITQSVKSMPGKILEVGTGCGAIAIALGHIFPQAKITAIDIADQAIANAKANIKKFGLNDQINLMQTDFFAGVSAKFDLLVSNPPYIPEDRLKFLPKSVSEFEPLQAIDGGQDGIQFIKKLVMQGKKFLHGKGVMAIEIDEDSVSALTNFLVANSIEQFSFKKDLFNRFRYLLVGDFKNE